MNFTIDNWQDEFECFCNNCRKTFDEPRMASTENKNYERDFSSLSFNGGSFYVSDYFVDYFCPFCGSKDILWRDDDW